jgi:hypothetical protein
VSSKHARLQHQQKPQHPPVDQSNYQPANQPTCHTTNKPSTRSYVNVTDNDPTQNNSENSSANVDFMLTKFLDELKSVINLLITLLTIVITKFIESKNDK